jgi:hypothetical protein
MFIPMHEVDEEFMSAMPQRVKLSTIGLPRLLEETKTNIGSLNILSTVAICTAEFNYLVDAKSPAVLQSLEISRQALNALFACATSITSATVVQLGNGEPVTLMGKPDESSIDVADWQEAFNLNLIFRDWNEIHKLCNVPTELLRASSTGSADHHYLYKDALCAYIKGEPNVIDLIHAALEATDPTRPDVDNISYTLTNSVPNIALLMYVVSKDVRFEEGMQNALQKHRQYLGESKENAHNFGGFIATDLLALAVLGMNAGLRFEVESPYLPMYLIKNEPVNTASPNAVMRMLHALKAYCLSIFTRISQATQGR